MTAPKESSLASTMVGTDDTIRGIVTAYPVCMPVMGHCPAFSTASRRRVADGAAEGYQ